MKKYFLLLILFSSSFVSAVQAQFAFTDVQFWVGNGSNVAMLVIDFNDGSYPESFAWGYRFNGNPTAEQMIHDIDSADDVLALTVFGGFVSDILYASHNGIGGSPFYWGTFSGDGTTWDSNLGSSELISDSLWFGLSYTDFDTITYEPISLPGNPVAAINTNIASTLINPTISVWPNPSSDVVHILASDDFAEVSILTVDGKILKKQGDSAEINISDIVNGFYFVSVDFDVLPSVIVPIIIQR